MSKENQKQQMQQLGKELKEKNKQLKQRIIFLEDDLFMKNMKIRRLENTIKLKDEYIEKILSQSIEKNRNERGAGRKEKLNSEQIDEVINLRKQGETLRVIASKFNCSPALIHKIIHKF